MKKDLNKGITSIEYNYLNLPEKIYFTGNRRIEWKYSVSGVKLEKRVYSNGTLTLTQDYVSGFVYKDETLDFFFSEAGRIKKTQSGSLRYEYDLKDHLGNTRVSFTDANGNQTIETGSEVLMESHYYAFGLRIETLGLTSDNKFLYNGKELTEDFGLNWYEYGWRMYDAQLGRWMTVDPLDEYNTPYIFVGNMPLVKIDPDGCVDKFYFDPDNGNVQRVKAEGEHEFYVLIRPFIEINHQLFGSPYWQRISMEDALGYLTRGIFAEFGGNNQLYKEVAAEIIKGRTESELFKHTGQTYKGVLEDTKNGVQFSSTIKSNERYTHYSNPLSIIQNDQAELRQFVNSMSAAIKIHFGNENKTNGSLFFYSPITMDPPFRRPNWVNGKTETTPLGIDTTYMKTFRK